MKKLRPVQLIQGQYGAISDLLKPTLSGTTIALSKQATSGHPGSDYKSTGTLVGQYAYQPLEYSLKKLASPGIVALKKTFSKFSTILLSHSTNP